MTLVYLCIVVHYSDRCKLFCRISGTNAFFLLKNKVEDGTKCGPDTYDVCVNGKCRVSICGLYTLV